MKLVLPITIKSSKESDDHGYPPMFIAYTEELASIVYILFG
jgi:hypothetical protein